MKKLDIIRFILFPLIPVYKMVIGIRNYLFDKKILKTKKVNSKIVSVGNLTVGGSGKTPTSIYILKLLKQTGKNIAVLSRGYGRKSKGFMLVSDGNNILTNVEECGDEIYQTAKEAEVIAAVCEDRVKGANKLLKNYPVDVIVLDDAYQHRWLYRDIDFLVIEQRFLHATKSMRQKLLPTGNLREPFEQIKRADAVIINRKFTDKAELPELLKHHFVNKKIFHAYYSVIGFIDVKTNEFYKKEEFSGQHSLVVSGIANPFSFLNALRQSNVNTENKILFRDHKEYRMKEIQRIRREFYVSNTHSVITTEKDAVKLVKFTKDFDDIDIFYLKIELKVDEEEEFKKFLHEKLELN